MAQELVRLQRQNTVGKAMHYKGFSAAIRYDERDRIYHGQLTDSFDKVYFDNVYIEGSTVEELEIAFREAIDDYLAYCAETGRQPS